ncbi:MAG: Cytochrome bd-I ubiquinol oxidase subunit 2 [Phycisphaerae bacterium]|nr:Cytochrome bd-I ubiquinol oxidase subunit 2 [Phycisphaerae bacterium]
MTLQDTWFVLLFVLLIGYAIMDGYDLGVGALHILARGDDQRRISLGSIGPTWDGNEVWLLTAGGALFAAFPPVYATVFSGFYIALMLLLAVLIGRAVALEFRSRINSPGWRRTWDATFWVCSAVPALLLGVAFGNVLRGVPLNAQGDYAGTFIGLLNPFSLLVGVLTLVGATAHGAIYLAGKCEGEQQARLVRLVGPLWALFIVLFIGATAAARAVSPFLFERALLARPLTWVLLVLAAGGLAAVVPLVRSGRFSRAFVASSAAIGAGMALAAGGLYPRLLPCSDDLSRSLTIANSSSTPLTLKAMLVIALVGMPAVLVYTAVVHHIFRGKVKLEPEGY